MRIAAAPCMVLLEDIVWQIPSRISLLKVQLMQHRERFFVSSHFRGQMRCCMNAHTYSTLHERCCCMNAAAWTRILYTYMYVCALVVFFVLILLVLPSYAYASTSFLFSPLLQGLFLLFSLSSFRSRFSLSRSLSLYQQTPDQPTLSAHTGKFTNGNSKFTNGAKFTWNWIYPLFPIWITCLAPMNMLCV